MKVGSLNLSRQPHSRKDIMKLRIKAEPCMVDGNVNHPVKGWLWRTWCDDLYRPDHGLLGTYTNWEDAWNKAYWHGLSHAMGEAIDHQMQRRAEWDGKHAIHLSPGIFSKPYGRLREFLANMHIMNGESWKRTVNTYYKADSETEHLDDE